MFMYELLKKAIQYSLKPRRVLLMRPALFVVILGCGGLGIFGMPGKRVGKKRWMACQWGKEDFEGRGGGWGGWGGGGLVIRGENW